MEDIMKNETEEEDKFFPDISCGLDPVPCAHLCRCGARALAPLRQRRAPTALREVGKVLPVERQNSCSGSDFLPIPSRQFMTTVLPIELCAN